MLLLLARSSRSLPEIPLSTVVMMIASVFGFFGLWTLYDRMREFLPSVMHCGVCGTRLRRLQMFRNLSPDVRRTYPFRLVDGTREEQPVRALCHRCERRARQYRSRHEPSRGEQALDPEPRVSAPQT